MQTKSFDELSKEDQALVSSALGEENYKELRATMIQIKGEKIPLKRDVKGELVKGMKKEPSLLVSLFLKPIPSYAFVVAVLLLVATYFLTPARVVRETLIAEKKIPVTVFDTVLVVQVDTLWRDRIVKVPVPMMVTDQKEADQLPILQTSLENKSNSDQEDLLDLVVRGR